MLTFHGVPISVHTRKAIVAAIVKGIDYKVEPVIPFNPPQGWDEISPTGLIPVMTDGDFRLADSTAICQYLDRKHDTVPLLPAAPEALGRAAWLDAYAGGTLFRHVVHGLFVQKIIRPKILKQETDTAAIDKIRAEAEPKVFRYLDAQCAGPFLVGDRLTLADIAVASNLINYQYLGFRIDGARYPRLAGYARAIADRAEFRKALTAESPVAEQMGLDRSFLN